MTCDEKSIRASLDERLSHIADRALDERVNSILASFANYCLGHTDVQSVEHLINLYSQYLISEIKSKCFSFDFEEYWTRHGVHTDPAIMGLAFKECTKKAVDAVLASRNDIEALSETQASEKQSQDNEHERIF